MFLLGSIAEYLSSKVTLHFSDIPLFPAPTVKGHAGKVLYGKLGGVPVLCLQGRVHYYEGHALWKCVTPVRVMKLVGISYLLVTNAAGGINPNFKLGNIMMIKDHIFHFGFGGKNPLRGPNDERFGTRFPAMNNAYDKDILQACLKIAEKLKIGNKVRTGVYSCVAGPSYETIAELKFLKMIGADAVGMSTAHEVIAARHCGMKVVGFSLITNECILEYDTDRTVNHAEVLDAAKKAEEMIIMFVENIVGHLNTLKE